MLYHLLIFTYGFKFFISLLEINKINRNIENQLCFLHF